MLENDKTRNLVIHRMIAEEQLHAGKQTAMKLEPLLAQIKSKYGDSLLAVLLPI